MTFEEWLKEEYGTSFKGDFDDQFLIELEMAFEAGRKVGYEDGYNEQPGL